MRHNYTKDDLSGEHWAVGVSQRNAVLVQIQEGSNQARIEISVEQALSFAAALTDAVYKAGYPR